MANEVITDAHPCRFEAVSLLPDAEEQGRFCDHLYQALFDGEPAVIKLLFSNHGAAAVHQAWAENGLAPPLLASEPISYRDAETGMHMVRCC